MSRSTVADIEAQVRRTQARPLSVLPKSWWDESAAVNMADWIERNVPDNARLGFTYGVR